MTDSNNDFALRVRATIFHVWKARRLANPSHRWPKKVKSSEDIRLTNRSFVTESSKTGRD